MKVDKANRVPGKGQAAQRELQTEEAKSACFFRGRHLMGYHLIYAQPFHDHFTPLRTRFRRLQEGEFRPQAENDRRLRLPRRSRRSRRHQPQRQRRPRRRSTRTAQVIVFGYHRFEKKVRRPDTEITPEAFEAQMQELKDENIPVIGMQDFLAWKRGEKAIPPHAAIITIDDG